MRALYKSFWKMPAFILLEGADPVMPTCFTWVLLEAKLVTKTRMWGIHARGDPKPQERRSREREARNRGKPV